MTRVGDAFQCPDCILFAFPDSVWVVWIFLVASLALSLSVSLSFVLLLSLSLSLAPEQVYRAVMTTWLGEESDNIHGSFFGISILVGLYQWVDFHFCLSHDLTSACDCKVEGHPIQFKMCTGACRGWNIVVLSCLWFCFRVTFFFFF